MSAALSTDCPSGEAREIMQALPSISASAKHGEIWGIDLQKGDKQLICAIIQKVNFRMCIKIPRMLNRLQFIDHHCLLPSLQVARTKASLTRTLEWRRRNTPRALISEAKSTLPGLNLLHLSEIQGKYVMWVTIEEKLMRGYAPMYSDLRTSSGLVDLGLAVLELLADLLLTRASGDDTPSSLTALCVVDFKLHDVPPNRKGRSSFRATLGMALEELVSRIHSHYPGLLEKAYIIRPGDDYLASLDIPEYLLRQTVLLENPKELVLHLGPDVPPEYGGQGAPLADSDLLKHASVEAKSDEVKSDTHEASKIDPTSATACPEQQGNTEGLSRSSVQPTDTRSLDELASDGTELRLIYSETIGPPEIILDPEDLKTAEAVAPGKQGASLAFADSDMVVKYGYGVRLAEAEAMFLVSKRTTIPTPKLLSAYILDGTGYIIMSYEEGEPLGHYFDRVSEVEQGKVLQQLRDYVEQMRSIKGDFIGGIDYSSCCDGIFEGGFGDYTKYSYGPYESEESFNEGIIQALRDRLPAELLKREGDPDSVFFTSEFLLYQTVRGLKGHEIVFTHGDLHHGNIIVRADGTVVLLDWGSAGFWPEYWEFYRAMFGSPWKVSWDRMVEKFIPPYYVESAIMQKVFATVWY